MLKRISLENWKSHKKSTIDFTKGSNIIIGSIGSGKSSIVEAISFAFFGTTQKIQSRNIAIKDLITKKPYEEDSSKISLIIEKDNAVYRIERLIFKNKSAQARLYANDVLIAGPKPNDVNEKISELFGISFEQFMRANYSEQNKVDYFVNLAPKDRKLIFDKLFGIDIFDKIEESSRQSYRRVKIKADFLKESLEKNQSLYKNLGFREIKKEINDLEKKIKEISLKEKKLYEEKEKIESILEKIRKTEEKIFALEKELFSYNKELKNLSNVMEIKESLEDINKKIKEEESTLKDYKELYSLKELLESKKEYLLKEKSKIKESDINKNKNKLIGLNKEIKLLEESLKIKKENYLKEFSEIEALKKEYFAKKEVIEGLKNIKDIEKIYKEKSKAYEDKCNKLTILQSKISEIEKELELWKNTKDKCPLCNSEINHEKHKKIKEEKEKELKEYKSELENIKKEISKIDINYLREKYELYIANKELLKKDFSKIFNNDLLEKKDAISKEEEKLKLLKEEEKLLEKEINEAELNNKRRLAIETELKEIERKLNSIKINKDIISQKESILEELKKLLDAKEKSIRKKEILEKKALLERELSELRKNTADKESIEKKYESIKKSIISINTEKKFIEPRLRELYKKKKQGEELLALIEEEEKKEKRYRNIAKDLKIFSSVAKKTQELLRKKIVKKVNIIFSDLWSHLYPYKDIKKIEIKIDSKGDYKINILFSKHNRELDAFISGGERSLLALCLRIAISLAMQNKIKMLILDEPTHNLDKKAVEKLSILLNEILPQYLDQVIIITHEESLLNANSNIIEIKRDKENDAYSLINNQKEYSV